MKNIKTIITMNQAIDEKQCQLKKELKELSDIRKELQDRCEHDIVFKLYDNAPRKIGTIYNCYCPICRKTIVLHMYETLENSPFEKSKIINLNGLHILNDADYEEVFSIIQKETFDNYNYYYNKELTEEELSKSMSNAIKETRNSHQKAKQRTLK